jgi:hypothetical protein
VHNKFGLKKDYMKGDWGKLHNDEFRNLYYSPGIIRMIMSRKIRWAGHVVRMERRGMHVGNGHAGSIKCWEVLEWLHNWLPLK